MQPQITQMNTDLNTQHEFKYVWRVRARLPERFGSRCAVVTRARRMNSCLVRFEDGLQVVTSRNYLRKAQ